MAIPFPRCSLYMLVFSSAIEIIPVIQIYRSYTITCIDSSHVLTPQCELLFQPGKRVCAESGSMFQCCNGSANLVIQSAISKFMFRCLTRLLCINICHLSLILMMRLQDRKSVEISFKAKGQAAELNFKLRCNFRNKFRPQSNFRYEPKPEFKGFKCRSLVYIQLQINTNEIKCICRSESYTKLDFWKLKSEKHLQPSDENISIRALPAYLKVTVPSSCQVF